MPRNRSRKREKSKSGQLDQEAEAEPLPAAEEESPSESESEHKARIRAAFQEEAKALFTWWRVSSQIRRTAVFFKIRLLMAQIAISAVTVWSVLPQLIAGVPDAEDVEDFKAMLAKAAAPHLARSSSNSAKRRLERGK